jgi:prepilin signal peptidase PulO-like enzyme (type II secretory pathway)
MTGKLKAGEQQPLGPFIAASATVYILFRQELLSLVDMYMNL